MEYAKPIMDFVDKGVVKDANKALQVAMLLWNYSLDIDEGKDNEKLKRDIIKQISRTFKLNTPDAGEFFKEMIYRKNYLFPPEVQPRKSMTMFVRKDERYLISEFNYDSIKISAEPIPPDHGDEKLVAMINRMDKYIDNGTDYEKWEDYYLSMENKCIARFRKWLMEKGIKEYSDSFSDHIGIYLNFIYRYIHEDQINLKTVTLIYIGEFFADHLLRKMFTKPNDYIEWPPALKLFYQFLNEKGYLTNPEQIIKLLDEIEPNFIEILRDRFS